MPNASEPTPPNVSIVIPMYNEAAFVERLVDDLARQDYAGAIEVLVADGGSTDGSVELLTAAARRAGLDVRVLDNPDRFQSHGLNRCIRAATGDVVIRLDAHTHYDPNLVRNSVDALQETRAWVVGGNFECEGETVFERAAACAYDSPFGGTSWTRHQYGSERVDADIVYYGTFPRFAFERVGLYDEALQVGELEDLCERIRGAGGRVVYDPALRIRYRPRDSFRRLFVQYYRYGLWKVGLTTKHGKPLSGRSVVPFVFVTSLAALGAASPRSTHARRLLAFEVASYATAATAFGAAAIRRRGERLALLPRVAGVFATFHVAHGLGQWHGWARAARRGPIRPSEPRLEPPRAPSERSS